jgi:hypothetical protein
MSAMSCEISDESVLTCQSCDLFRGKQDSVTGFAVCNPYLGICLAIRNYLDSVITISYDDYFL